MNYEIAYLDLAAQVRRLGIVADVQIGETIHFGENHDARQMALAVLATVATLNELTLQLSSTPDTPLEAQQQAQDDDTLEAKLRDMFAVARFPAVEDVYISTAYSAYVTFSKLLTVEQVKVAGAALNLSVERSDPRLKNRYRVTFKSLDREEG